MKISETNALGPVSATPRQNKPATPPDPADTVSSPDAERLARAVAVTRQTAGAGRTARLDEIAAAIKSGNYRPDAGRIAEQILDAASLDARLQALLSR